MSGACGYEEWMAVESFPTDVTIPAQYWGDNAHWMFDPWASQEHATNIHSHKHTAWAERIFDNWAACSSFTSANFKWDGETIFIVGRGASLKDAVPLLNKHDRKGRAIWLNSAFVHPDVKVRPPDHVMAFDAAISSDDRMKDDAPTRSFITAPTMDMRVIKQWGWARVHGFTFWNKAPLNDFMRRLYPQLPQLVECLGVNVSALHLAAKCGAKKIVLVGQDCVSDFDVEQHGLLDFNLPTGKVSSDLYYSQLAMAVSILAFFVHKRTGAEIVNCSGVPMIGHNLLSEGCEPLPWMKCDNLENHI